MEELNFFIPIISIALSAILWTIRIQKNNIQRTEHRWWDCWLKVLATVLLILAFFYLLIFAIKDPGPNSENFLGKGGISRDSSLKFYPLVQISLNIAILVSLISLITTGFAYLARNFNWADLKKWIISLLFLFLLVIIILLMT